MTVRTYSYPFLGILADYARAVVGLGVCAVPFLMGIHRTLVTYMFAVLICLFVGYGARTVLRHFTRFEVGDEGLAVNLPKRRGFAWKDVDFVRLRFYSLKRDRKRGWLQLVIGAGATRISMESTIAGFRDVLDQAVAAAGRNGIVLDETTAANLESLSADGAEVTS